MTSFINIYKKLKSLIIKLSNLFRGKASLYKQLLNNSEFISKEIRYINRLDSLNSL